MTLSSYVDKHASCKYSHYEHLLSYVPSVHLSPEQVYCAYMAQQSATGDKMGQDSTILPAETEGDSDLHLCAACGAADIGGCGGREGE